MKKISALILLFVFNNLNAQQICRCYTNEYIDYLNESNPNIKENISATFQAAKESVEAIIPLKSTAPNTIYRIPVVFHVVYKTNAENITDAQLQSQIDVLNADFRKLNADTINLLSVFPSPTRFEINIKNSSKYRINEVFIANIEGKRQIVFSDINKLDTSINVSELENGLYFVSIY